MIVLAGFMGAGKSTAARELAADAGVAALDADELLAERLGAPIEEVFAQRGEAEFRRHEEELVVELLRRGGDGVLALGGGAVESARVREALRGHLVVLIDVDARTAWRRVRDSGRPLARDRAAFDARLARRRPLYDEVADWVVPAHDRAALRAYRCLRDAAGLRAIWASTAGGEYPIVLGPGARIAPLRGDEPTEVFELTDANVAPLWAPEADFAMPAGERHKTLGVAEQVWRAMARAGVSRGGRLRAVGGGVVTDLGGFCAATYQRGIAVVHVPTTLLAMVDAAIGGKTGVDLPEAKNYVGAYHQPSAVLADTETLSTLPRAQVAEGYAEVVKTALIAGGRLWERVASGAPPDDDTIFACARTKVAVVAADERDGGVRQVLNLGHTVGHALETVSGYALTHGQAVALGLLAALRLSGQEALRAQVAALLAEHGLPTATEGVDVDAVVEATRRDKKRVGRELPFVLVAAPGDVRHGQPVADADLRAAVAELRA